MRAAIEGDLLLLNLPGLMVALVTTSFPYDMPRLAFGIPFVLFCPGYALIAAVYPGKEDLSVVHRVGFGLGLSLAVVPLIGLSLHWTFGIVPESVLYSTGGFILAMSIVAWVRRGRLPLQQSFGISFHRILSNWHGSILHKCLGIVLAAAIVGMVAVVGMATVEDYALDRHNVGDEFTEFYLLLPEDIQQPPRQFLVGRRAEVNVGVVNREHKTVSYRLIVVLDGVKNSETDLIVLKHGEKWERPVSFIPSRAGVEQELEVLLYADQKSEPYLGPLRFWVDVIE